MIMIIDSISKADAEKSDIFSAAFLVLKAQIKEIGRRIANKVKLFKGEPVGTQVLFWSQSGPKPRLLGSSKNEAIVSKEIITEERTRAFKIALACFSLDKKLLTKK